MVTIHCSYNVIPSESTPITNLPLSPCDQTKLPTHGCQFLVFPNSSKSDTNSFNSSSVEKLTASLSKALVHYYPLAGRLSWIHANRLQLLCNSKGALLLDATCHHQITGEQGSNLDNGELVGDLGLSFPPHLVDQLVPKVDYSVTPIEDMPLLLAQVTTFSCGGITLGLSLCRAVLDGSSVGIFLSSWARFARGDNIDCEILPLLDRNLLDSLGLNVAPRFHHAEFSPPPMLEQGGSGKPHLATALLKITKGQVLKLKRKANASNSSPFRGYTSFEAISGYLWRCVCKVRCYYGGGCGAQRTSLTTLVNCRNKIRPPLPLAYFGNATFPTVTPTCSAGDIAGNPLGYAAGNVREAIERMSDEYVRSAIDFIAGQKDMSLLRENLYGFGGGRGNPNLYVVSWTNFPFYETDFGWGKPSCLVPATVNSEGKVFLMNDIGGGFVVAVCLQSAHVDALKKLFYEDMEEEEEVRVMPNSKL